MERRYQIIPRDEELIELPKQITFYVFPHGIWNADRSIQWQPEPEDLYIMICDQYKHLSHYYTYIDDHSVLFMAYKLGYHNYTTTREVINKKCKERITIHITLHESSYIQASKDNQLTMAGFSKSFSHYIGSCINLSNVICYKKMVYEVNSFIEEELGVDQYTLLTEDKGLLFTLEWFKEGHEVILLPYKCIMILLHTCLFILFNDTGEVIHLNKGMEHPIFFKSLNYLVFEKRNSKYYIINLYSNRQHDVCDCMSSVGYESPEDAVVIGGHLGIQLLGNPINKYSFMTRHAERLFDLARNQSLMVAHWQTNQFIPKHIANSIDTIERFFNYF